MFRKKKKEKKNNRDLPYLSLLCVDNNNWQTCTFLQANLLNPFQSKEKNVVHICWQNFLTHAERHKQ